MKSTRGGKYHILVYTLVLLLFYAAAATAQPRIVTTIGGRLDYTGTADSCGNEGIGGLATDAVLRQPYDVCVDSVGNVYCSAFAHGVMRIDAVTGIITHVAGGGSDMSGSDTIPATNVPLTAPGICIDNSGRLLMATGGSIMRVNLSTGYFDVVAGTWPSSFGYSGDGGPATAAGVEAWRVAVDAHDNIYFSDQFNAVVRRVDAVTGLITTVAGTGMPGFSGDGGPATAAKLSSPHDIRFDTSGNMYILDVGNYRVRQVDAITGIITTIAGAGGSLDDFGGMGGPATAAFLNGLHCLSFDDTGYLYIVSGTFDYIAGVTLSSRISRVNMMTGIISMWAGGHRLANSPGYPGDGLDADSAFFEPIGLCFDTAGNAYIADDGCRVRKIWAPVHEGGGGDTTLHAGTVAAGNLNVYPNPAGSRIQISGAAAGSTYMLQNIAGVNVAGGYLQGGSGELDIAGYAPGIYVLYVVRPDGVRHIVRVQKE